MYSFSLIYILISLVILPLFKHYDYFVFFRWSLFSSFPEKIIYDYSWDNGKTFLFRDHQTLLKKNFNLTYRSKLFHDSRSGDIQMIKNKHFHFMSKLSPTKEMFLYKLHGTLAQHIIQKQKLSSFKLYKVK
jgi:hypothetical protein